MGYWENVDKEIMSDDLVRESIRMRAECNSFWKWVSHAIWMMFR